MTIISVTCFLFNLGESAKVYSTVAAAFYNYLVLFVCLALFYFVETESQVVLNSLCTQGCL